MADLVDEAAAWTEAIQFSVNWLTLHGHAAAGVALCNYVNGMNGAPAALPAPTTTAAPRPRPVIDMKATLIEGEQGAPPALTKETARATGFTGDQCTNCNSMRMKVAGHCLVCEDCGTTTGCS